MTTLTDINIDAAFSSDDPLGSAVNFDTAQLISGSFEVLSYIKLDNTLAMRPDVISNAIWGNADYIEQIAIANDRLDPLDFSEGDIVCIPTREGYRDALETKKIKSKTIQPEADQSSASSVALSNPINTGDSSLRKRNGILIF